MNFLAEGARRAILPNFLSCQLVDQGRGVYVDVEGAAVGASKPTEKLPIWNHRLCGGTCDFCKGIVVHCSERRFVLEKKRVR